MTDVVLDVLTFAHILAAMGWLGGGLLTAFAVGPNLRKMTPVAALEFNAKVLPNMVRFVQGTAGATVLFGVALLGYVYSQDSAYFSSAAGQTVSVGIVLAVVTFVLAMGVTIPSFKKVSRLAQAALQGGQQGPPPPEMMSAATRARQGATLGVILLLVTLATMVVAVNS